RYSLDRQSSPAPLARRRRSRGVLLGASTHRAVGRHRIAPRATDHASANRRERRRRSADGCLGSPALHQLPVAFAPVASANVAPRDSGVHVDLLWLLRGTVVVEPAVSESPTNRLLVLSVFG